MMDGRVALAQREIVEHFAPLRGGVFITFDDWHGADVALATGWQTAYPVARLPDCKLKAYLVQDHEPDFYPASAERMWAEGTYGLGLPCLTSSPWLKQVVQGSYGVEPRRCSSTGSISTPTAPWAATRPADGRLLRAPRDAAPRHRAGRCSRSRSWSGGGPTPA